MRLSLLAMVALGLSLASADALTISPLPFSELVARADTVAYGRVADVAGQWTADREGIESVVTLDVLERYKGSGSTSLTFKLPGGRAGNTVNVIPGVPTLREGDLVVLFLASRGPAIPAPVGLTQGVLPVGVDARSGALRVVTPLGFGGQSGPIVRGDASRAPMALAALADGVRALVGAAR